LGAKISFKKFGFFGALFFVWPEVLGWARCFWFGEMFFGFLAGFFWGVIQ
jgi:hypothetical protein